MYCIWLPSKQISFRLIFTKFCYEFRNSRPWTTSFNGLSSEIAPHSMAQAGLHPIVNLLPCLPVLGLQKWAAMVDLKNLPLARVYRDTCHVCWDWSVCAHGCMGAKVAVLLVLWAAGAPLCSLRKFLWVLLIVSHFLLLFPFSSHNH